MKPKINQSICNHNWEIKYSELMKCSICKLESDMTTDENTSALERSHILDVLIEHNIKKLNEQYGKKLGNKLNESMNKTIDVLSDYMQNDENYQDIDHTFDGEEVEKIITLLRLKLNLECGNW